MTPTDLELLQRFVRDHAQDAFTEVVRRHLNLVYSAALRQVRSPQLAEDVAQSVFSDLARNAAKLDPNTVLAAWLHAVTRRTAVDVIRHESRRRLREQIASELKLMDTPDATWNDLEPLLDEAVAALDETDRSAVLLRYFENKSLREVGAQLGVSEDAAQKRVGRAVEKLREFFSKRKITVAAGSLGILISANAVQSAPAGLAVAISAGVLAGATITASTAIATTKIIAMTTLQKAFVAVTVIALAGVGIFEAYQQNESQKQIQSLQQRQSSLDDQLVQSQRERDDATNRFGALLSENARLRSSSSERELIKLRGRVAAASQAAADATAKIQSLGTDSEQSRLDVLRNQTRGNLRQLFKLVNLSPDKADQYVNLEVEMQERQDERMKALLSGTLSVADALRQRDQDNQQQQDQRRDLLGPDGWDVLQSIADGMRNNIAKGLTDTIQANMSDNVLTQEQCNQLQSVIKTAVAANTMDDVDLFRPVAEWTQMVTDQEKAVLQTASGFLTPAQQATLQSLEQANLALLLQQRNQRIQALGIKQ
jgi:RNA polymerase sigma factor (sigma-70 family)